MKENKIILILLLSLLVGFVLVNQVLAAIANPSNSPTSNSPTSNSPTSTSSTSSNTISNFLNDILSGNISQQDLIAILYAALVAVVVDVALRHTTVSEGSHIIALLIAGIFLFSIIQNPSLINALQSLGIMLGLIVLILILLFIPGAGMSGSFRLIVFLIVLAVIGYLYFNHLLIPSSSSYNNTPFSMPSSSLSLFGAGLYVFSYFIFLIFGIFFAWKIGRIHPLMGGIFFLFVLAIIFLGQGGLAILMKTFIAFVLLMTGMILSIIVGEKWGAKAGGAILLIFTAPLIFLAPGDTKWLILGVIGIGILLLIFGPKAANKISSKLSNPKSVNKGPIYTEFRSPFDKSQAKNFKPYVPKGPLRLGSFQPPKQYPESTSPLDKSQAKNFKPYVPKGPLRLNDFQPPQNPESKDKPKKK